MGPSHEYKVRIRDYHFNTSIKRNWSPSVKVVVSKKRGGRSAVPMHFLCLTPNCSEGGPSRFIFATKKVGKEKANKERGKAFEVALFLPFIKYWWIYNIYIKGTIKSEEQLLCWMFSFSPEFWPWYCHSWQLWQCVGAGHGFVVTEAQWCRDVMLLMMGTWQSL